MRRIASLLFLIVVFLFSGRSSVAEDLFTETFHKGFGCIYNFEFKKADSLVSVLKKNYPQEYRSYILGANYYWWKIRSGEDDSSNRGRYSSCLNELEKLLEKRKAAKELKQEDVFNYINLFSYRARLELLDNNYLKVISYMNKCNSFILLSSGKEDSYEPFNLTSGIYNCFMAATKKDHPLFAPYFLLAPACNMTTGLKQLIKCCTSSEFLLQTEANYFLMILYGEGDINYSLAESFAEKLCSLYSDNLLYRYYSFKVLLLDDKKEKAMQEYKQLYLSSITNKELTPLQQKHFLSLAQKDLEAYYKHHPSK